LCAKGLLATSQSIVYPFDYVHECSLSSLTPCGAFIFGKIYLVGSLVALVDVEVLEFANEPHFLQAFYQPTTL